VRLSTGEKRLGCDADHLHLHSCDVKNEWSLTSTRPALIEYTGANLFEVHLKYGRAHYNLNLVYSKTPIL